MLIYGCLRRISQGLFAYNRRCISVRPASSGLHGRLWMKERLDAKACEKKRSFWSAEKRWDDGSAGTTQPQPISKEATQTVNEKSSLKSEKAIERSSLNDLGSEDGDIQVDAAEKEIARVSRGSNDNASNIPEVPLPSLAPEATHDAILDPLDAQTERLTNTVDTAISSEAADVHLDSRRLDLERQVEDADDDVLHLGIRRHPSKRIASPYPATKSVGSRMCPDRSTQLIRVISFTEALHTLRFGDARDLPIDSVVAGFWNYHRDKEALRCTSGNTFHIGSGYYEYLLVYLLLRGVASRLPRPFQSSTFIAILDLHKSSNVCTTLHNAGQGTGKGIPIRIEAIFSDWLGSERLRDQRKAFNSLLRRWSHCPEDHFRIPSVDRTRILFLTHLRDGTDPAVGREVKVADRMQLLKTTSFAEALHTFRFGDADTLDLASVLSGWYHHNEYKRNVFQPRSETFAHLDHFDVLLFYVVMKDLYFNWKSLGVSEAQFCTIVPDLYSFSAAITALREARSIRPGDFTASKFGKSLRSHIIFFIDQQQAAGYLLHLYENQRHLIGSKASYEPIKLLAQTPLFLRRLVAHVFWSFPRKILESINNHNPDIPRLRNYLDKCSNPDLFFHAMKMTQSWLASSKLHTVEQKRSLNDSGRPTQDASVRLSQRTRLLNAIIHIRQQLDPNYEKASEEHDGSSEMGQSSTASADEPTTTDADQSATAKADQLSKTTPLHTRLERAVANGSLLETHTIDEFLVGLSDDQQTLALGRAMRDLKYRVRRGRRRGLSHRVGSLQELLKMIRKRYKRLQTPRSASKMIPIPSRPWNRFTKVSYATLEEEIKGMKKWEEVAKRTAQAGLEQYTRAVRQNSAYEGSVSRAALKRRYETSILKQQMGTRHRKLLEKEASLKTEGFGQPEELVFNQAGQFTLNSLEVADKLLPFQPLYVPYNIHHYVLGNILDQLKEAMYKFGHRELPAIMRSRDWSSPESVPVADFMAVMAEDPDIRDRYMFFAKEFRSLRYIRNSYAHSISGMTLEKTHTLLSDMCTVAQALRFSDMVPRIKQYQGLLASFEHNYQRAKTEWRERELAKLYNKRNAELRKLDKMSQMPDQMQDLESERSTMNDVMEKAVLNARRRSDDYDRELVTQLAQDLAAFALEEHIRRSLRAMPAPATTSLVQRLFTEYSSGSTVRSDTNAAVSEQSSGAEPAASTPRPPLSASSSETTMDDSYSTPSLTATDATEQTVAPLQSTTSQHREITSNKFDVDLYPDSTPAPTLLRDRDTIRYSRETGFRSIKRASIVEPNLLNDKEPDALTGDPSFNFLQNDDHLEPPTHVALNAPRTPISDEDNIRKKTTGTYIPPRSAPRRDPMRIDLEPFVTPPTPTERISESSALTPIVPFFESPKTSRFKTERNAILTAASKRRAKNNAIQKRHDQPPLHSEPRPSAGRKRPLVQKSSRFFQR